MQAVLVMDADSLMGRALCGELGEHGFRILAHMRRDPEIPLGAGITILPPAPAGATLGELPPVHHVIFTSWYGGTEACGIDDLERLITTLDDQLCVFLAELRATGELLARGSGGQIWVLTQENSMDYYAGPLSLPIDTLARQAAVKSFAKEVFRFGVRVNCANIQPVMEQVAPEEWHRSRNGLKAFAMRFKPNHAIAVARLLRNFLAQPELPIAGMVVPVGIGFAEHNI